MGQVIWRKQSQRIRIGDSIVTVKLIRRRAIAIHVESPPEIFVRRLSAESKDERFLKEAMKRERPP